MTRLVPKLRSKIERKFFTPKQSYLGELSNVHVSKHGRFNLHVCTLTEGRAFQVLSKTFQWWFVCCGPPLMNPNPVATLGPHRVKYAAASRLEIGFSARGVLAAAQRAPEVLLRKARRSQLGY
jgi:hypothetical protein